MSNKTYKKTSIGLIPADWEVKKLSDVTLTKGDYGINAAAVEFNAELPAYIRITDIDDDGNFNSEKKKSVNDINSNNFYLKSNDLVFVRTGATVGKSYLYDEKDGRLVFAGFLIRFKVDTTKANDYFLWTYTKSKPYWDWVKAISTRSGQPGINSFEYSSLQIPLPPLPEQQKIASILSTWDIAIDKCKVIIDKLKVRNKALAQQLLLGKIRVNGFEGTKWKKTHLKDIIEFYNKKSTNNDQFEVFTSSKTGLVKQKDYFGGNRISERDNIGFNIIPPNYITYRSRSDDGRFTFNINEYDITGIVSIYYPVFRVIDGENKILVQLLNMFTIEVGKYSVGTSQLVLGMNDLKKVSFNLPDAKEQKAIANILDKATEELNKYQQKLQTLQLQKKGLMQQLLTGKVRVKI